MQLLNSDPTPRRGLRKSDFKSLKHHELPGHEQETFTPAINKRSAMVGAGAAEEPVHNRLYKEAAAKSTTKKATIVRSYSACLLVVDETRCAVVVLFIRRTTRVSL